MDVTRGESGVVAGVRIAIDGAIDRVSATPTTPGLRLRGVRGTTEVDDLLTGSGLRVTASIELDIAPAALTAEPARSAIDDTRPDVDDPHRLAVATVVLDAPDLRDGEVTQVALVEEDGELRWLFPSPGSTQRFVVEVDPTESGDRSLFGAAIKKAVRFLAVKAAKPATDVVVRSLASVAEQRLRPTRLRSFTAANYGKPTDDLTELDALLRGPAVLFVHGTNSATHQAFDELGRPWVEGLLDRYGHRAFAFDHRTISVSPAENAREFAEQVDSLLAPLGELGELGKEAVLELDIVAHSRGGLVAREIAALEHASIRVRSIVFVATPNNGTPLCDADHLGELVDTLTNLAAVIPSNPITDALEVVVELVKDVALDLAYDALPGIKAMSPTSPYLAELNDRPRPPSLRRYAAIATDYEPLTTDGLGSKLRDRLADRVFDGAMNDLVVPTRSAYLRAGEFSVDVLDRLVLDSSRGRSHSTLWEENDVLDALDRWLRPELSDVAATIPPAATDPNADLEAALVHNEVDDIGDVVETIIGLPGAFKDVLDQLVGGPVPRQQSSDLANEAVVLIPGIMGSLLDADDGRIWISPRRLGAGSFRRLSLARPRDDIRAVGLNPVYTALAARLAQRRQLTLFPFDWRLDIADSADALAPIVERLVERGRPVHFVAHSMGGLVARAFIARHPDLWSAMRRANEVGGHLVMLGTPNRGSYAIPLVLSGDDLLVKAMATVDVRSDRDAIRSVIATFPGVYQMLPAPGTWPELPTDLGVHTANASPDDHDRLYDRSAWGDAPIVQDLLDRAGEFHRELDASHDRDIADRMVFIAGDRRLTPARLRIDGGAQSFGRNDRGDGRVLHRSGVLPDVRTYFVDAGHGGLVTDASVLDQIDLLLSTRKSEHLSTQAWPRRGLGDETVEPARVPAAEVDPEPTVIRARRALDGDARRTSSELRAAVNEATSMYLPAARLADRASARPRLTVSVTHASLEQARHPVVVGHYQGLSPEGAEGFLDRRLDGALLRHHHLRDYPEQAGDVLFVSSSSSHRPPGGIVVGLGEFGSLTRSKLVHSVKQAVITRVLRASEDTGTQPIGISAVLVGTPGRYGLPVSSSVAAIVEGAATALVELDALKGVGPRFEDLEIIELYAGHAANALTELLDVHDALPVEVRNAVDVSVRPTLRAGRGRRPGRPRGRDSGEMWPRFIVERKLPPCPPPKPTPAAAPKPTPAAASSMPGGEPMPGAGDISPLGDDDYPCGEEVVTSRRTFPTLEFSHLGRSAQVDRLSVEFDDRKIRDLIAAIVTDPRAVAETFALFEMLFPHEQKLEVSEADNLHLVVDEHTASIPWELLCGRGDGNPAQALAMRSGLLRQLRPDVDRRSVRRDGRPPVGNRALVIGDPPTGGVAARLPGARAEAEQVTRFLEWKGYLVESLIFDDEADPATAWSTILTALYRYPYRIVHLATHGVVDPDRPERSGLLIGPTRLLTALDLQQMSATPSMVVLNACHVGRTGTSPGGALTTSRANELAAHLGLQLMRNGVQAVVAAGWAVDDRAALTFAVQLYQSLFDGDDFGQAVRSARRRTFDGGATNTWGAYQCYGDPGFALPVDRRPQAEPAPVSATQLVERLKVEQQRAGDANSILHLQGVHDAVRSLDEHHTSRFGGTAAVYVALGDAYGALGCYADAVWAYRQAEQLDAADGSLPLTTWEQLANMEVYAVAVPALGRPTRFPARHELAPGPDQDPFAMPEGRLTRLLDYQRTHERLVLMASLHKKRAVVTATRGARRDADADIEKARDRYLEATRLKLEQEQQLDGYGSLLWIQMSRVRQLRSELAAQDAVLAVEEALLGRAGRDLSAFPELVAALGVVLDGNASPDDVSALRAATEQLSDATETNAAGTDPPTDIWSDTQRANVALTRLVLDDPRPTDDDPDPVAAKIADIKGRYLGPFDNRSTVRSRNSAIHNIRDLAVLLPQRRSEALEQLAAELELG